jgi:hypothetical protein
MLAPAALAALLLAADGPNVHFGGEIGLGFGVPFNNANVGFQMSAKPYLEFEVAPKIGVGIGLPFGVGFNSTNYYSGIFGSASINYTTVDIMPGVRGSYAVMDWVWAALDVGLGPSILSSKVDAFGTSQSSSKTFFAMRVGLEVMVAPPQLSGVTVGIQPLELNARVGDSNNTSFSEYRFSVLVGYRH